MHYVVYLHLYILLVGCGLTTVGFTDNLGISDIFSILKRNINKIFSKILANLHTPTNTRIYALTDGEFRWTN